VVELAVKKKLLIVYFSEKSKTHRMAEFIGEGAAKKEGLRVLIKRVEECGLEDILDADGLVVGSPTYFSNVSWQIKKLIDESIVFYRKDRQLRGRVFGSFTSAGHRRDAEDCIRSLELAFGFHHKMDVLKGIISARGYDPQEVAQECKKYGERIADSILKKGLLT
jgi:NAD(P)H dehydrogenase (quinone)